MNGINEIRIKNFKAFPTDQRFVLGGKHLLVYGENGSGKSSLYWTLYTLFQGSEKGKNVAKYFDKSNPENLLNIFSDDDDSFIEISFVNAPEKFYRLSKEGLIPNDQLIQEANLASDFISHRLLINFYNFRNSKEINLYSIFERDILPFFSTIKGENFLSLYNDIISSKPYTLREGGVIARISEKDGDFELYLEKIKYFNEELKRLIGNINEKVTDFYVKYFKEDNDDFKIKLDLTEPLTYDFIGEERTFGDKKYKFTSSDLRILNTPFIKLTIEIKTGNSVKIIDRPQSFLNEAKLTAIALSIRFSVLDERPTKPDAKILALDDLLISLDMSHREVVLNLLFSKYAEKFQLILLTHDKAFYNLAQKRIKIAFKDSGWTKYQMFADVQENIPTPKVEPAMSYFATARKHFDDKDYPACANYQRKVLEQMLKNKIPEKFRISAEGIKANLLGELLTKAHSYFSLQGFDESLLHEIEIYRELLLNPLSHDSMDSIIYKGEIENIFKIIGKFARILNDIIIPVDTYLFFQITTNDGTKYFVKFQVANDVRVVRKKQDDVSSYGEVKGNIVSCKTVKGDIETDVKWTHDFPMVELGEIYKNIKKVIDAKMKEKSAEENDILNVITNMDGMSLNQLKTYYP